MMKISRNNTEYAFVDYIKLVCAVLVVAIHTGLITFVDSNPIKYTIEFFESLAVPFFFCVTGYFYKKK